MAADLDAIQARADAATQGPWERGAVWLVAGVLEAKFGPGKCGFCDLGEPVWIGKTDIHGTVMLAHRHRDPSPYDPDHHISGPNGEQIAGNYDYEVGGIIEPADAEFIAHSRTDMPDLLAELRAAREVVEAAEAVRISNGSMLSMSALSTALVAYLKVAEVRDGR